MDSRPFAKWSDAFGTNKDLVQGYTLRDADTVARWFLTIPLSNPPRTLLWNAAAREAGLSLESQTTWSEIATAWSRTGHTARLSQPMGTIDRASMDALLSALASVVDPNEEAKYAVWEGYADMAVLLEHIPSSSVDASEFVLQGGVHAFTAPLRELSTYTSEEWLHLPSAVWLPNERVAVTQPIYHDSCYVSAPRELCERLCARTDIDVIAIDPSVPLPSGVVED